MISFTVGGIIPLLGGVFIRDPRIRLAVVAVSILQVLSLPGLVRMALSACVSLEDGAGPV